VVWERSKEHEIGGYEGLYIGQNGCLRHPQTRARRAAKEPQLICDMDIIYINSNPVLYVIDKATCFQATH
jgi:hypothetical protein